MALDIKGIYDYCKIEMSESHVMDLIEAAEAYIVNSITQKDLSVLEKNPLFCLAVKMLVLHWHDHRGVSSEKDLSLIPMGIESLMAKLDSEAQEGS
ncbi:hypothetical protein SDC9_179993 [bioreactor metagenome]|uniref:Phage gp6-like head-tail connector protein n=1 Tax=bioreactor metagenome TaxID=1076179 RepID=A0A645H8B6_9ZZZZ